MPSFTGHSTHSVVRLWKVLRTSSSCRGFWVHMETRTVHSCRGIRNVVTSYTELPQSAAWYQDISVPKAARQSASQPINPCRRFCAPDLPCWRFERKPPVG